MQWQVSTLVREEEEAYHAEDIVYPLRRLAANEPGLDDSLIRQSSMYGEHACCPVSLPNLTHRMHCIALLDDCPLLHLPHLFCAPLAVKTAISTEHVLQNDTPRWFSVDVKWWGNPLELSP